MLKDTKALGKTKVRLRGTSQDINVKRQMEREGVEVVKKLIPKSHLCQRCRNLRSVMRDMARRKGKKGVRELSIEESQRFLRQSVLRKVQQEQQEKLRKEAAKKKFEERTKNIKGAKAKVGKEEKKGMPLISKTKGGAELMKEEVERLAKEQAGKKLTKEQLKTAEKVFKEKIMKKGKKNGN
jgi:hypothetical protein